MSAESKFVDDGLNLRVEVSDEVYASMLKRAKWWYGILIRGNPSLVELAANGPVTVRCPTTGESADYTTLPTHDVPCPCGNPNHWFVKYEKA